MHTRAHTAALTRPIAAALGAVAMLAFVVAVLARTGQPGRSASWSRLHSRGLAIWSLIRLVRSVWDWDRTLLLVSEEELVIQRRGLRRSESIVPLRAIHRLRVRRSISGACSATARSSWPAPDEGQPAEVRAAAGRGLGGDQHLCWPP